MVSLTCERCGKIFERDAFLANRSKLKFCSRECYQLIRKAEWVQVSCARCQRQVTVRAIYVARGQYKYCGDDCRRNAKTTAEEREKVCLTCGCYFRATGPSARYSRRRHCSLLCRQRRPYVTCAYCGRHFKDKPRPVRSKYCTRSCYRRATMSLPQRVAKLALEAMGVVFEFERKLGRYYVDFLLPRHGLVIEVDGEYWHALPRIRARDALKDAYCTALGYTVVRIPAQRVLASPREALEEAIGHVGTITGRMP